jgi:alkyl sulfatase BDS1-like metallo-beta-lactamase superfamily hydrolase
VLPPSLSREWHTQGFDGSVSHNVKAIYQRYMTWFDGSAENLWKWPPKEEGARYVACMGGAEEVLKKSQVFISQGDLRFAATLLGHVVAAGDEPGNDAIAHLQCKNLLANVFEKLGFGAENATWRNFYLSQSLDLMNGKRAQGKNSSGMAAFAPNLSVEQWFGALSITIDGQEAGKEEKPFCIDIHVRDISEDWRLILSNVALTYRSQPDGEQSSNRTEPDLTLRLNKIGLCRILNSKSSSSDILDLKGDVQALNKLLSFASITSKVKNQLQSYI